MTSSHRLSVKSTGGNSGRIETPLKQPYAADQGRYNVDVRYYDAKGSRSRISLFINGEHQGSTWENPGQGQGWTTRTVPDVSINTGDRVAIAVETDSGTPAKLDYVEVAYIEPDAESTAAVAAQELDDPDALPGQVIVAGTKPGYLKYNGGGPVFLCGPDNPEDFLFRGELNPDGNLHPDERRFIEGVVKRLKHRKNILWGIEESCNKLPAARTPHCKKIGAVIAAADNHNHPIVQSFVVPNDPEGDFPKDGITSDPYIGDPNIRVVTWLHVPPHRDDLRLLRDRRMGQTRFPGKRVSPLHQATSALAACAAAQAKREGRVNCGGG